MVNWASGDLFLQALYFFISCQVYKLEKDTNSGDLPLNCIHCRCRCWTVPQSCFGWCCIDSITVSISDFFFSAANGKVFAFGSCTSGACGLPDNTNRRTPTLISNDLSSLSVRFISAGDSHSLHIGSFFWLFQTYQHSLISSFGWKALCSWFKFLWAGEFCLILLGK